MRSFGEGNQHKADEHSRHDALHTTAHLGHKERLCAVAEQAYALHARNLSVSQLPQHATIVPTHQCRMHLLQRWIAMDIKVA